MLDRVIHPAIRYHGAKFRLAPWILQHFPPHAYYVESFGGAAGVLLQKPRVGPEVYNDLDGDIVNFFRVLRDPVNRQALLDALALTPYAREEFELSWKRSTNPVERARRTAIRAQMGFGSAGATKGSTGFRTDIKRSNATAQMAWLKYPDAVAAAGQRLASVLVERRPAVDVMLQHDSEDTLHYVDPPYVHSTRSMRVGGGYRHEMTDQQHRRLLDVLQSLRGMVVLSGYATDIHRTGLPGWQSRTTEARIALGRGTGLREETVWLNPACWSALQNPHGSLFGSRPNVDANHIEAAHG